MKDGTNEKELREKLDAEIDKWQRKLSVEDIKTLEGKNEFITNIKAYAEDADHFYKEGKLVESFEALVWAWAWLEIGKKYNFVD